MTTPRPRTGAAPVLPERRLFWAWVWDAVRPVLSWVLVVLGAVALFLGWYGASGTPVTAKQVPYVVSGGLVGVALVVLGAALLAGQDAQRQAARLAALEQQVAELHRLLTEPALDATGPEPVEVHEARPVALEHGSSYHRADCRLVEGKDARPVDEDDAAARGLRACRLCEPADLRLPAV